MLFLKFFVVGLAAAQLFPRRRKDDKTSATDLVTTATEVMTSATVTSTSTSAIQTENMVSLSFPSPTQASTSQNTSGFTGSDNQRSLIIGLVVICFVIVMIVGGLFYYRKKKRSESTAKIDLLSSYFTFGRPNGTLRDSFSSFGRQNDEEQLKVSQSWTNNSQHQKLGLKEQNNLSYSESVISHDHGYGAPQPVYNSQTSEYDENQGYMQHSATLTPVLPDIYSHGAQQQQQKLVYRPPNAQPQEVYHPPSFSEQIRPHTFHQEMQQYQPPPFSEQIRPQSSLPEMQQYKSAPLPDKGLTQPPAPPISGSPVSDSPISDPLIVDKLFSTKNVDVQNPVGITPV